MKLKKISTEYLKKISNYVWAEPGDICYKAGNVLAVCNINNDINNITVEALEPSVLTVRNIISFIWHIHKKYNIDYIQIKPDRNWPILNRVKSFVDPTTGIHYIKIKDNLELINKERNK